MADETNKNSKKTAATEDKATPKFSQPSFGLEPERADSEPSEPSEVEENEPQEHVTPVVDEPAADPSVPEELAGGELPWSASSASEISEVSDPSEVSEPEEDVTSLEAGPSSERVSATPDVKEAPVVAAYEESEISEASEPEHVTPAPAASNIFGSAAEAPAEHVDGLAAYFDYPGELLVAAAAMRDDDFKHWDAFSPFPIHGIEDAMGLGRSWLPWVTFAAGLTGLLTANLLQFGTLTFDWPMIIGGKPYAPWPSFVPIMFELTVLIGGVTTALVMLIAAGCFRKPKIIDPEITKDRFVIWIDAKDPSFHRARGFLQGLDPVEIRDVTFESQRSA